MTKRRPMTEEQWQTETSSYLMLQHLHQHHNVARQPGGQRLLRLFRCACCRSAWELFEDDRCKQAVEVAERHADAAASRAELALARTAAEEAERSAEQHFHEVARSHTSESSLWRDACLTNSIAKAACWTAVTQFNVRVGHIVAMNIQTTRMMQASEGPASQEASQVRQQEDAAQADFLRDLFGTPWRSPVAPPPAVLAWNNSTVLRMAQAIYQDRSFDLLPVLADALVEAGCDDEELLAHCRGKGPHVRGCWAVDLLCRSNGSTGERAYRAVHSR
jgi:hypothetical protein